MGCQKFMLSYLVNITTQSLDWTLDHWGFLVLYHMKQVQVEELQVAEGVQSPALLGDGGSRALLGYVGG